MSKNEDLYKQLSYSDAFSIMKVRKTSLKIDEIILSLQVFPLCDLNKEVFVKERQTLSCKIFEGGLSIL